MKKLFFILAFAPLLATACAKQPTVVAPYLTPITIGSQRLYIQVVTSNKDMEQGLGGRASMPEDSGMVFDFGAAPNTVNFWMKDMQFGLDFLWVTNGKIVGITPNVPAPDVKCQMSNVKCSLPLYPPPAPVNQVIEVNAGWAEKNKIKIGDEVRL